MSLDSNISDLATRVGQEIKDVRADMALISGTRNWIDYVTIKNLEDLGNGIIKYTDTNGSYYRKIIDSPYEDIIYADATLTIELTRR